MSIALEKISPIIRKETLIHRIVKSREYYFFLLPTFIFLIVFNYSPAFSALYHSFFNWNGAELNVFVGLQNFVDLANDPNFHIALINVAKVTLSRLVISLTFPLLVALLIYRLSDQLVGYGYKVLYVIPMVVPYMVIFLIWKFIYTPNGGILNELLELVNLGSFTRTWLGDFKYALIAIVFVGFPWISGFQMLVYLAGLQDIPISVIEASIMEGVGPYKRFFLIELPMISSQIKLIVILTIINVVQGFVDIMVMTNGGPGKATMVPGLLLYKNAMQYGKMGYASTIGTILFLFILTLTSINLRYMKSNSDLTGV